MLKFISNKNLPSIIVFIHGFIGGENTWIREDENKSILDYIIEDKEITNNYDVAVFSYFTKITDFFTKNTNLYKLVFNREEKKEFNIDVENIGQLLQSELAYQSVNYEKIIYVAHSMGGLVAKSAILDEISKNNKTLVKLFISLAVPHRGSNIATLGKIIFGNPQVKNLEPLSEKINLMNDLWVKNSVNLPKTVYFQAKYDTIVPLTSPISVDARQDIDIVYTDDDHFTIVCPKNSDDIVIKAIKKIIISIIHDEENIENEIELKIVNIRRDLFNAKNLFDLRKLLFRIERIEQTDNTFEIQELKRDIRRAIAYEDRELPMSRPVENAKRYESAPMPSSSGGLSILKLISWLLAISALVYLIYQIFN